VEVGADRHSDVSWLLIIACIWSNHSNALPAEETPAATSGGGRGAALTALVSMSIDVSAPPAGAATAGAAAAALPILGGGNKALNDAVLFGSNTGISR